MTVLEQISNPYLASLALGLLYGLTFCTSACLPYLVSYIAGIGAGFKKGFKIALYYNTGRIAAYTIIGTIVGLSTAVINKEIFIAYQEYSSFAFGALIIAIGATILLKKPATCACVPPENETKPTRFIEKLTQRFDIRAFFMGFTRGLIICPPLIALLLYAVAFSPADCVILAVLFGIGTTLSPLLILSGATGWLLNKAPLFKTWVSKIGGAFLILMGTITLFTATLAFI
jgi:sulfite exporter TauE/SafE